MALIDDWKTWRKRPFPAGVYGLAIGDVDVVSVDTFAAGCLDTYFDGGRLDQQGLVVLEDCVRDLHGVLPLLSGEAFDYFDELAALCRGVLGIMGR